MSCFGILDETCALAKGGETMIAKILVATDGSDHANKAIEMASELALKYNATLSLVHVVYEAKVPEGVAEYVREEGIKESPEYVYLEMAGKRILDEAEKLAKKKGVKNIQSTVLVGDPAEKISQLARENDVNMIFLGSRGLSKLGGLMLGSVSSKVCHLADRTCVTVK